MLPMGRINHDVHNPERRAFKSGAYSPRFKPGPAEVVVGHILRIDDPNSDRKPARNVYTTRKNIESRTLIRYDWTCCKEE